MEHIFIDPASLNMPYDDSSKSTVEAAAESLYSLYSAFVNAGFSEDQAMTLTITSISFAVNKDAEKKE